MSLAVRTLMVAVVAVAITGCRDGADPDDADSAGATSQGASPPSDATSDPTVDDEETASSPETAPEDGGGSSGSAGACDLLTPALAAEALGSDVELNPNTVPFPGSDECSYLLVGGSTSTYATLLVISPDSELYSPYSTRITECGAYVLSDVDDVAPGAQRCVSSSSTYDEVRWISNGRAFVVRLNASGEDLLSSDAGIFLAREIAN